MADDSFWSPYGGVIAVGRFASVSPLVWAYIPTLSFTAGVAKSIPVAEYLPDGGSAGDILMAYAGSLPSGISFNPQTRSFDYTGVGSGTGSGKMAAKTIPLFATIGFKPTAASFPTLYYDHGMQDEYQWSFAHQFPDNQVPAGSYVYCLSVKNGSMYQNDNSQRYETFRCEAIDYWPSGCLKNATLSGQFMAVWKDRELWVASNLIQLIAVAEPVVYGAIPSNPLTGDVTVLYESTDAPMSSNSNTFTVVIT